MKWCAWIVVGLAMFWGSGCKDSTSGESSAAQGVSALAGFATQTVVSGLNQPTSFAFAPAERIFVAEKSGVVRVWKNGSLLPTPLIDISATVNSYWDRGLLGLALDPSFATNGYIYLLYTYEAAASDDAGTKTGRLSRYTVVGDTASPSTEQVILGTNVGASCSQFPVGSDCIPEEWYGHGVGDIDFGTDGSMFLTVGDASSWAVVTDDALRALNLDSLAGKILRVDRSTGSGLPDNPYWNGDPSSARSKVWAYGVRNAYRFSVRPGSGTPGIVYAGDVGWDTTEEVDAVPKGANLGWPCYEGNAVQPGYEPKSVCQTLYAAVALDPSKWTKPIIAYNHAGFLSSAVTGGVFYTGTNYPPPLQGQYFFGDYARNQIQYATVSSSNVVTAGPTDFDAGADSPVDIEQGPDGNLYYLAIGPGEVRKYVYAPPGPAASGYLSDMAWSSSSNGWGPVERDLSNGELSAGDGRTITLNGVTYTKGLGTHAAADIRYPISGCTRFQSDIGVDDEVGANGSVAFQVYLDGTQAYNSGTMTGSTATKSISVDVTGKSELRLVVTNGGDNFDSDHADWASARITCGTFTVNSVSPADGALGVAASTNVTAAFSADIDQATLTSSTFTLASGTTTLAAALSYDATTRTAILDPSADLQPDQIYTATVLGGAGGVKDTSGNTLAASKTWTFTVAAAGGTTSSYLSDMAWSSSSNGWGPVERDLSNGEQSAGDGRTITLNGVTYTKGLGTHAAADIRYPISGCTRFQSDIGVDDEVGTNGSVAFQVYLDGAQTYNSGTMTGSTATKSISVDVTGKSELRLVVTNGGDNIDSDHADWASARITCGASPGNQPPVPSIVSPTGATTFAVGDVISFQGSAVDPEDGALPDSALTWQINIQHCVGTSCHIHYFMTVPGAGGTFTVPDHGGMYHFDLTLTATDSGGASSSTTVSINPRTLNLTLTTVPVGLQVVIGGTAGTAPFTTTQVDGATITAYTPSPQSGWTFSSWSDGGAQQHNITLGTTDVTYTATFAGGPTTSFVSDLSWTQATNGLGPVERDMSNGGAAAGDGQTLTLNGVAYTKGLGVHSASDVRFALGGKCTSFTTDIGVDDEVGNMGSVAFHVYLDGTRIYNSGKMTGSSTTKKVALDVTGTGELRLVVVATVNGTLNDSADWANARLTCIP